MNLLLLPGNSPRHAGWVKALKNAMKPHTDAIEAHQYHHWETGEEWADIPTEIAAAAAKVVPLKPYTIIAKSIGTAIAIRGTAEGMFSPEKIILLGVPIEGESIDEQFMKSLKKITEPIVIIQNTNDPYGAFENVKTKLKSVNPTITYIETPGDSHDYLDFELIAKQLTR
ncbi:hypothetical protein KI440_02710 [Candidatus Saccharibacteria bacterium TM7i]|nr:hypothetical protein KI440_02710 [Candidatus Saccharibacteria bacterium TM7i]